MTYCFPRIQVLFASILLLYGCASTSPVRLEQSVHKSAPLIFPDYHGKKSTVAIIPLGLSKEAAQRYPHLLKKSVGLGVHNMLMDELYNTKHFTLVEDKQSVIKNTFQWHALSQSGMVAASSAVQVGKMLSAKSVIYGEVYDYSEGGKIQTSGFTTTQTKDIRVGIQMRMVNVETLEVTPASGIGHGSSWGEAAQQALHQAVGTLIQRY